MDNQNLEELIKQYTPLVGLVIKKKNYYGLDRLDDLMQVGIIGLWQGLKTYDPNKSDNIINYLFMTINGYILGVYRKNMRQKVLYDNVIRMDALVDEYGENINSAKLSFVSEGIDVPMQLVFNKIKYDIFNLEDRALREILIDRYYNELSMQQIADKHGFTKQNVDYHLKKFFKEYKDKLINDGYFDQRFITR